MITKHIDYDLSTRNTFRMQVRCALFVEITEEADLPALDWASLPQPVMVMGGGSNLLFTQDFPGTILHYAAGGTAFGGTPFTSFTPAPPTVSGVPSGNLYPAGPSPCPSARVHKSTEGCSSDVHVTVPAGVVFDDFCAWAAAEGLWGPENLSLIPGEVGASAVQNIGAYGVEAKDIIADIRAWDRQEGCFVHINPADCAYGYRTSRFKTEWKGRYIITAVTYRLSRTPQPRLDYGGVRKALEAKGVSTCPSGNSTSLRSVPAPPTASWTFGREQAPPKYPTICGPLPLPLSGGGQVPEGHVLTPQLVRDTIIGIRRQKLPAVEELGSAGSFFCNPVISREHFNRIAAIAKQDNGPDYQVPHYETPDGIKVPAAWMIDQCGLKGRRNGGAQVYPAQPLVIVNASGTATPQEIIGLEQQVIRSIERKYGVTLHPEVEHI